MIVENIFVLPQALLHLTTHTSTNNAHTTVPTNTHQINRQQHQQWVRTPDTSLSPQLNPHLNQNNLNKPSHTEQM